MSVTPEPISRKDERQSDSIHSKNTRTSEESFLLPSILRGAAYISSGGRVYRLFSDNDEISFPMASFEKTLQLDPLPEIPPIEDFVSPLPLENIASPLEDISESLIRLLSVSSEETSKNIYATPSILQLKQQPPSLSVTENCPQENHLSKNSQNYYVSKNLPSKEKTAFQTGCYKIFSETEQDEHSGTTPRTPLYHLTQKKNALRLFEAFPELTVSPDVSATEFPATSDSPTSKNMESTATPIIRTIRLDAHHRPRKRKHCFWRLPLQRLGKVQHSQPAQQDNTQQNNTQQDNTSKSVVDVSVLPADKTIEQFIPQIDAQLIIPSETKLSPSETKSLLPELSSTEPSDNNSDTLPFPLHEQLSAGADPADYSGNDNGTWRLIWQSHWPEHLKSLELAASDQICFLADHLEIQKEQMRKVFSFNSIQCGDGCTTLALCASRELAERGYRVLLVDAHRQNPELPQLLHLKTNPDFYEIITLIPDRLELLPWSETSIEINTNDHTTQSFAEIVGSFRDDYDFILLDNGSLVESSLSDHLLLWREMCSDGVLLVLNMKNPASISVRTIAQRLQQNQINLLGIVENYV
jgi:Mrp family chromosome partitioning ATPase